jgi:hypothetical protein
MVLVILTEKEKNNGKWLGADKQKLKEFMNTQVSTTEVT